MNFEEKLELTAHKQHSVVMDLLRMALGVIILIKGIYFVQDTDAILIMLHNSKIEFMSFMLSHYVAMAHLVGGVMIILGLLTRIAILFQIPILLGAVIFVNSSQGFFSIQSELLFSLFVLALLVYFLFYGSGPLSLDEYMKKHRAV
jgi:putative oxidoreductase